MSESIPIPYLRIWCLKNQRVISFERKSSDKYVINKDGVFLSMPDGSLAIVSARQVFPTFNRYPTLLQDDLEVKGRNATTEFYMTSSDPNGKTTPKFVTLEVVRKDVESYLSLLTHLDEMQFYVAVRACESGLVSLPHLNMTASNLTPEVTLSTLLMKQNLAKWEDILAVCLDLKRSATNRVSHDRQAPTGNEFDLSGEILIAIGVVTRTELQRAMQLKNSGERPIGEILIEMGACTGADIENCLKAQSEMKNRQHGGIGLLGELMVEGGFVRHEDVYEALRLQKISRQNLDGILVSMGVCTDDHILQFKRRGHGALLPDGSINEEVLADYMIMSNLATPKQIEEAFRVQKRGRQMLGELLVNLKRCSEQDVQRALEEQHARRKKNESKKEKIGELLISRNLVSSNEIETATAIQQAGRQKLGSTLVHLGACTEDDFKKALELQFSWRQSAKGRDDKLGDELLKEGLVTEQNLTHALALHERAGKPLGEILVQTGSCTPEVVIDTLIRRDLRRQAAFAQMIAEVGPRVSVMKSRATQPAPQPESEKSTIVKKVSSWFFKKERQ